MASYNAQQVVLFPEGPGYIFISKLAKTGLSKVMIHTKTHRLTEYRDEVRSNSVVTATYWELYDAGTLEEVKEHIGRTNEPVSERFLFSILRQMLKAMLNVIKAGILHTDAHAGNWFLNLVNGGKEVKFMLGDWGLWRAKPEMEEHERHDTREHHSSDCELCNWYFSGHTLLTDSTLQVVRDLMWISDTARRVDRAQIESRCSESLSNRLKVIEAAEPKWYPTGKEWVRRLEEICDDILRVEQRLATAATNSQEDHNKYRQQHANVIPTFDDALRQIDWFDDEHRVRNGSVSDIVHFWKVAHIDPDTNEVVSLAGRPDGYRRNVGYQDHTSGYGLPLTWKQAHGEMKEKLRLWGVEQEQPEHDAGYGHQGGGPVRGYSDTSMPF
ncbi:hypothetical protein OHC33_010844 [Knufia fluminis]|uniref:Protein kinase domain-containing protein n=1 Tax=Knufia fluminis TaxID=191047 RepID=A0AAN8I397_9EURO|nr:hypothetical protein OHC33_010844 [Knufia fluminis]